MPNAGIGTQPVTEPKLARSGNSIVASWNSWTWGNPQTSRLEWLRLDGISTVQALDSGQATYPFEFTTLNDRLPIWVYRGPKYGTTLSTAIMSGALVEPLDTLPIPFENPVARTIAIGKDRALVLTMRQGREMNEPMVASYATVLEYRCSRIGQREWFPFRRR